MLGGEGESNVDKIGIYTSYYGIFSAYFHNKQ